MPTAVTMMMSAAGIAKTSGHLFPCRQATIPNSVEAAKQPYVLPIQSPSGSKRPSKANRIAPAANAITVRSGVLVLNNVVKVNE